MRVLLSTIGTRGDVQPLVALATELRAAGADVQLCVPPDFQAWIEGLGFHVTPIGPELRKIMSAKVSRVEPPSPEQQKQMARATVSTQFETITAAARGCDVIVGATALQIAARSVAESMGIRYVFVAYCPAVLPSPLHAPPVMVPPGAPGAPDTTDIPELWARDARRFDDLFGDALRAHRASVGLAAVYDVRSHILTDRPWLAADPTLGPWPDPTDSNVLQTGAWILPDERPLSPELERFLDAGEPPVYFGFGSMRAPHENVGASVIEAARALGRRAIVSRGWADLALADDASDCIAIDEVNQQALFRGVAAVVHHGGAGTTTAAALCGAPQVVVPQLYDQFYWARRVQELGIGSMPAGTLTTESLTSALAQALSPEVASRAKSVGTAVSTDGAAIAAKRLLA